MTRVSFLRVVLVCALLLFSQTYLGQEWLAALILLASFAALMVFLAAVIGLALFGWPRREEER